jgi:hypothetical protein
MKTTRPAFRKPKSAPSYDSPEELFVNLPSRASTHGYLRGPQQDALRIYNEHSGEQNVALELPTGTGKTAVGLVIAEWHRRRSRRPVAYLTLTNQLAGQVLKEAQEKLGLPCADLRGTKETRNPAEVGRYKSADAIGVTTYSNLMNANPVINEAGLLIFDDAHGGEQYVAGMWTVKVTLREHPNLYKEMLTVLRPAMSDSQYRAISEQSSIFSTELVDTTRHNGVIQTLTSLLDNEEDKGILFPWRLIRNHLKACLILVSQQSIIIRPLIAPTHVHNSFASAAQRVYMSATLSGEADLLRGYGVTSIKIIQAQHPQWGKRYIFAPGLYMGEDQVFHLIGKIFDEQSIQRALVLAPSYQSEEKAFSVFRDNAHHPSRLRAKDVEESLSPFTNVTNAVLTLAGRYDGIDLPGDHCRLLILFDSPAAVGALERHLLEHWQLGPLLRRRERTRLIQGMGRCTRDATDYAVVLLVGQSIVDAICTPALVEGLPGEIQREIAWGREQGASERDEPGALGELILGIMNEPEYRSEANTSMEELTPGQVRLEPEAFQESAKREVKFSRALWEEDYSTAYQTAKQAADAVSGSELSGYRAWWLYLASLAASYAEDAVSVIDCLNRVKGTGINSGFADYLLRSRRVENVEAMAGEGEDSQVDSVWSHLNYLGWNGPKFSENINNTKKQLATLADATTFHMGLEALGKFLGAKTIRSTDDGAPDVVWVFLQQYLTFEAKTGKKLENPLSKTDLLQANAHADWVNHHRSDLGKLHSVGVIVAQNITLDNIAEPFAGKLKGITSDDLLAWVDQTFSSLTDIRTEFSGKEYGQVKSEFKARLNEKSLLIDSVLERFTSLSQ